MVPHGPSIALRLHIGCALIMELVRGKETRVVDTSMASICKNTVNQRKAKLLLRDRNEQAALMTEVNTNALLAVPPIQSKEYDDI